MSDYNPPADNSAGQPPQQPPPGGQPPQGPGGYGMPQYPTGGNRLETQDSGFFGALFDFSFSQFVTPKIVKLVYVLATIGLGLAYVIVVIAGFSQSAGAGLVLLVVGAIIALVYLAFIRMTLEFYYAIVRMSQDINRRLPGA
ncbi:MAG: DUF4282 domain-containing protein [Nocardioidaceae bacterium]